MSAAAWVLAVVLLVAGLVSGTALLWASIGVSVLAAGLLVAGARGVRAR